MSRSRRGTPVAWIAYRLAVTSISTSLPGVE
jgi:hypothetical protein